jgi:CelD/BcsL family acetyltransferase involved in cellulose biosynthesis
MNAGPEIMLLPEPWRFNPPGDLRILDVRSLDSLAAHEHAWNQLLLDSSVAFPMNSYPQISAFMETQIKDSESWLCLFAYERDQLIGVLPLIAARSIGVLGFRLLLMKTPFDSMHTGSVDCLTLPGREDLIEIFTDYLSRVPRAWLLIRIREISKQSPTMVQLAKPGKRLAAIAFQTSAENYIEVPSDLTVFHARLSSKFKRQLRGGLKKLEAFPDLRFLCREESRPVHENMRRFEVVENAGWKGRENTSVKAMPANARFCQLAAERYAAAGWMEWNFIEGDGTTIGAHYAVRVRRTIYLLKIGYDERYSAFTPGNVLIEKAVEYASAAGDVDEINFVADCEWHRHWGMARRELHDVIILPLVPFVSSWLARFLGSDMGSKLVDRLRKREEVAA